MQILATPFFGATGDFISIASTTVGAGGAANITFSSIPATYTHLQIRSICRDTSATNGISAMKLTINTDTLSTYTRHILYGDGASAASAFNATTGFSYTGIIVQGGSTANMFSGNVIDILDYANTNKYKTIRGLSGADRNGSGEIDFISNLWQSTAAITTLAFTPNSGNFGQYSTFALYGIKA